MTESGQPGIPPRIELDPRPEAPKPIPYQTPAANFPPPPTAWDAPRLEPVPWEDEQAIPGVVDRLWATIRLGFTDPMDLSARVPATDPILPAWLFFLITGIPATILSLVLSEMTTQLISSVVHTPIHRDPGTQLGFAILGLLIGPFIGGAFLHLFLWMWGGAKEGLGIQQTIRFGCYAQGVYQLVGWIPILNIPLGIVFWIFFSMGLAKTHRTDTWRGFAATLTPVIVCCCIGIGAAILIPAMLMGRH
ncbi:MAG TPA: Yip1 family protein [Holophagaceae bacterium]|nr:Yip1 family protein [Holophagaceae bacterium]